MKKIILLSTILIIIDQAIKTLIAYIIPFKDTITIINNFFYITFEKNYGAAWSILQGNRYFLIVMAIVALIVIYKMFISNNVLSKSKIIIYSMLISGIVGNLIDRIIHGFVIDYLEFHINNYYFPIFNLADTLIVVSIGLISYMILKEGEV